jgi:hypothetical protein
MGTTKKAPPTRTKKPKPVTLCKPGGPYCIALDAILDADVRRGAQHQVLMSMKTCKETRTLITHAGIVEGKKTLIAFTFCPACGARLIAEKPAGKEQGS